MEFIPENLQLLDADKTLCYKRRKNEEKTSVKFGQRKLLLVVIQFLTNFWDRENITNPVVVYAGAAPGNNIRIISQMFPSIVFHLYDPRDFKIKETENIIIYQQLFTDDDANQWSEKDNIYFISDIRSANYKNEKSLDDYEKIIMGEMKMQMKWYNIINPLYGHLKFRLPYSGGNRPKNVDYLNGWVFKQPWAPQTSTETRLVPYGNFDDVEKNKTKIKSWSVKKYEKKLFYHNSVTRQDNKYTNPFLNTKKTKKYKYINYPELLDDWDSNAEIQIFKEYLIKQNKTPNYKNCINLSKMITKELSFGSKYKTTLQSLRSKNKNNTRNKKPKNTISKSPPKPDFIPVTLNVSALPTLINYNNKLNGSHINIPDIP